MNFDYSDDEKALKDSLRRVLASRCDLKTSRRVLDGDHKIARGIWGEMGADGWLSAALPERYEGQGLGHVALCAVAEEMGRALVPLPLASITIVADAIARLGSETQKQLHLPRLGSGAAIGAFAIAEGIGPLTPRAIEATCVDGRLNGRKIAVEFGHLADVALVVAKAGGEIGLFLVDLHGPGVTRKAERGIDPARPPAEIVFDNASAEPLSVGWQAVEQILDRAAILAAFEQLGGADAALVMARDYALNRHAFGRPIGGFQAIKHKLADVYIANELARSNAYYGAWALASETPDLALAAATARVSATEAFERAARELIQTHGGIAITWEHDCQFYYRRSRHLALALGPIAQWRKRLVAQLAATIAA